MNTMDAVIAPIAHLFEPCPMSPEILCVWCGIAEAAHDELPSDDR